MRIQTLMVGLTLAFAVAPAAFAQPQPQQDAEQQVQKRPEVVEVSGTVAVGDDDCVWIVCKLDRRYKVLGAAARTLRDYVGEVVLVSGILASKPVVAVVGGVTQILRHLRVVAAQVGGKAAAKGVAKAAQAASKGVQQQAKPSARAAWLEDWANDGWEDADERQYEQQQAAPEPKQQQQSEPAPANEERAGEESWLGSWEELNESPLSALPDVDPEETQQAAPEPEQITPGALQRLEDPESQVIRAPKATRDAIQRRLKRFAAYVREKLEWIRINRGYLLH